MMDPEDADPELRDGPKQDLHSLRSRDAGLCDLSDEVQRSAAARAAVGLEGSEDLTMLRGWLGDRPVLVTGSAGYLGFALRLTLRALGVGVVGVDVARRAAADGVADGVADVADLEALRRCGRGCGAVLHTAALHAPHARSWHARDFTRTNVTGTANVLALGLPTVHTSTTSLTVTRRVQAREAAGDLVWLDDGSQRPDEQKKEPRDEPRNKYGRTKLEGERRCLAAAQGGGAPVVVLRAPRFFPEDAHEASGRAAANVKANELLVGRRCALVDVVDAHVRALARVHLVRGAVLTLAAPWPLPRAPGTSAADAAADLRCRYPNAARLFARRGWTLPDRVTRVYDATAAAKALGWRPRVTFEALLRAMEADEEKALDDDRAATKRRRVAAAGAPTFDELLCGKY